jgi:hypothetical protein
MTMGERPPVYPAAMSTLAETTTGPARWHATRVTAALLSFCAVVLVIVGSFLPLYSGTLSFGGDDMEVTISPWSADVQGPTEPGDVPTVGYPLVFAAIVLACAAAISWYAATPAATQGVGRVAGLTTAIGGAFLIGTVWTTSLMVTNGVDSVLLLGTVLPGVETEATYLVGYWLLLVAALLGLGAAVLALIPVRQPTWAQANPDVSTPPYGIAPVALPAQPPGLFQVDPLTGHPLPSPPTGYPQPYAPQPPGWQPSPAQQPFQPPANQQSAMQSLAAQEPVVPPQTADALPAGGVPRPAVEPQSAEPAAANVAQQQSFAEVPPPAAGAPSAAGASVPRSAVEPQPGEAPPPPGPSPAAGVPPTGESMPHPVAEPQSTEALPAAAPPPAPEAPSAAEASVPRPVAEPQPAEPAAAEVAQQQPFAEAPPPAVGAPSAAGASVLSPVVKPEPADPSAEAPSPAAGAPSAAGASIPRPATEPQPAAPPVAVKPPAAIPPPEDPAAEQKP